jgi:hypothetical protein
MGNDKAGEYSESSRRRRSRTASWMERLLGTGRNKSCILESS